MSISAKVIWKWFDIEMQYNDLIREWYHEHVFTCKMTLLNNK